jgi:hypothetical protein
MNKVRHLLWRLPVLLGAGALLTFGARATVTEGSKENNESARATRTGAVILKLENDQVYFSQDAGQTFEPLPLTATSEAARLKRLLQQGTHPEAGGAVAVAPTAVADGAGGAQWPRPTTARTSGSAVHPPEAEAPTRPVANGDDAANAPKGAYQGRPE